MNEIEIPRADLTKAVLLFERQLSGLYVPQWLEGTNNAAHVLVGSAGGANAVTTLLSAVTSSGPGASVAGTGKRTFQAVLDANTGASMSATVDIEVSNDGTNFITLGKITLSGTGGTTETDGFTSDAPWAYVRGNVTAISGTGANVSLYMGV